ncbi:MAG: PAAR domain-containing protein [Planctomycetota bacterium]
MGALFGGGAASSGTGLPGIAETYFGVSAPDGAPVIRNSDKTDHKGEVKSGAATVVVEGKEVARLTDSQSCSKIEPGPTPHDGGTIDQGVAAVLVEQQPIAVEGNVSICVGSGLATRLVGGQSSVMVGGSPTAEPIPTQSPTRAPVVGLPEVVATASPIDSSSAAAEGAVATATPAPAAGPTPAPPQNSSSEEIARAAASATPEPVAGPTPTALPQDSSSGDTEGAVAPATPAPVAGPALGDSARSPRDAPTEIGEYHVPDDGRAVEPRIDDDDYRKIAEELHEIGTDVALELAGKVGEKRVRDALSRLDKVEFTEMKLRWAQILEIEADIRGGGGSPERLVTLKNLRQRLLNQQAIDLPTAKGKLDALLGEQARARGVGTVVGFAFALDELTQADQDRAEYIRLHGREASWERDMGLAAKTIVSGAVSVVPLGLVLDYSLTELAENVGQAFGSWTYSGMKWIADRVPIRVDRPKKQLH